MTIPEALSRLARHNVRKDFSALTAPEVGDAIQALNLGMQELYQKLAPEFRQKPVSLAVAAPRVVSIDATNGSATLGASVFTTAELGRTVVSSGDTIRHRVGAEDELTDVWLGTTGTHSATIYGDAVAGEDAPFERVLSGPWLVLADGRERLLELFGPDDRGYWPAVPSFGGIGEPRAYWLQPLGNSQGVEPILQVRLLPLPDAAYRLRCTVSLAPRRIRFADVETGGPLPVPDNYAEALLSLAVPHLGGLPGWTVDAAAGERRDAALRFIAMNRLPLNSAPRRIGTPAGY